MSNKLVHLNLNITMIQALDKIAKRENKPRSYVIREMLESGIEQRKKKSNAK